MNRLKFRQLIEDSSFGTVSARAARKRTPREVRDTVLAKVLQRDSAFNAKGRREGFVPELAYTALTDDSSIRPSRRRSAMSKSRHVVPNPAGGWDVRKPGADRASSHHDTQHAAERRAKEILGKSGGGEVVIHDRHGRIRDKDSVAPANDPFPPRDAKH